MLVPEEVSKLSPLKEEYQFQLTEKVKVRQMFSYVSGGGLSITVKNSQPQHEIFYE